MRGVPFPSGMPLPPGRGTPSRWKGCPFHLGLHSRLEGLHLHHLDLQLSFLYGVMSLVVCKLQKLEPPPNGNPIPFGVGLMSFIVLNICRAKPLPNGTPIPSGTPITFGRGGLQAFREDGLVSSPMACCSHCTLHLLLTSLVVFHLRATHRHWDCVNYGFVDTGRCAPHMFWNVA